MTTGRIPKLGEALSGRELEVLMLAAHGHTNASIGRQLFLAEDTVRTHMFRIGKKLGASGRTNAVWLGCVSGQLPVPVRERVPL